MWELLTTEAGIRLGCLVGTFAAMAIWELVAPRRVLHAGKPLRWASNLGLVFLNTFLLRFIAPLGAVGIAVFAESRGSGLFHYFNAPNWLARIIHKVENS